MLKLRLTDKTKEFESLQDHYRRMTEENQRKRRLLQDLDNDRRNKVRRHTEHNTRLKQDRDIARTEYHIVKDQLDQLVQKLRFNIEDELKIYETLLNSFQTTKRDSTSEQDEHH